MLGAGGVGRRGLGVGRGRVVGVGVGEGGRGGVGVGRVGGGGFRGPHGRVALSAADSLHGSDWTGEEKARRLRLGARPPGTAADVTAGGRDGAGAPGRDWGSGGGRRSGGRWLGGGGREEGCTAVIMEEGTFCVAERARKNVEKI